MKLVFSKNEDQEISVFLKNGESITEFSYIDMIKNLIDVRKLNDAEFEGEFSGAEKESIHSMIRHINQEVTNFYSEDED